MPRYTSSTPSPALAVANSPWRNAAFTTPLARPVRSAPRKSSRDSQNLKTSNDQKTQSKSPLPPNPQSPDTSPDRRLRQRRKLARVRPRQPRPFFLRFFPLGRIRSPQPEHRNRRLRVFQREQAEILTGHNRLARPHIFLAQ